MMNKRPSFVVILVLLILAACLSAAQAQKEGVAPGPGGLAGVYDVKSYGAKGNGQALDTATINRAIEAAAAAGGDTVRFPAGTYLSFSIP